MSKTAGGVAKTFVKTQLNGVVHYVFSIKNAPGKRKHNHLELLGGKIKPGEHPLQALIRELEEEEANGILADRIRAQEPEHQNTIQIGKRPYYIFDVSISFDDYLNIRHSPKESLGFKLVPEPMLKRVDFQQKLTPRTRTILKRLAETTTDEPA